MDRIQRTKHQSSQQGILLVFFALIIVLAVMGWFWAQKSGHLDDLKHAIAGYLDKIDLTGKKPRQLLAEIETELSNAEKQLGTIKTTLSEDDQAMAEKLASISQIIETLPLAMDRHFVKLDFALPHSETLQNSKLYSFLSEICKDLQKLINIQKIDDSSIEIISPAQADQLRKNIQLKLTLAQLALSSEDRADLQSNLGEVVASMDRHFDKQAESVVEVLKVLDSLHSYRLENKES